MSKQTELAQVADTITVNSGKVGIGTSSPESTLEVRTGNNASLSSGVGHIVVGPDSRTSLSGDYSGGILFTQANGSQGGKKGASITGYQDGGDVNSTGITFNVHGTDGSANREEAMRIDSSGSLTVNGGSAWNELNQGTGKGSIHLDPNSDASDTGGAITFGASDRGSGETAMSGIYTRSDSVYGTKMYLATTDSYVNGPKTAVKIDHGGRVTTPRQPHINGSPRNTTGAGNANSFATSYSRNTLSFTNGRVTVPIAGVYLITFNTISDTSTGRVDSRILVNGTTATQALSEDNGQGFHFKSLSIALSLSASDYIEFYNADWYNHGSSPYEAWRTASVTLLS